MNVESRARFMTIAGFALAILAVLYYAYLLPELPAKVPIHFNGKGKANGYGHKYVSLVLFGFLILIMIVMHFAKRISPELINLPVTKTEENLPRLMAITKELLSFIILWTGGLVLFLALEISGSSKGESLDKDGKIFWILLIGLFVGIGFYLYRLIKAK